MPAGALVLAVLAVLGTTSSTVASGTTGVGNVNLQGTRKSGDQLLFEYRVTRRPKAFKVITEAVEYPMTTGQKPGVITLIEVRSPKRRHDEVHIKSGGVGERSATILFKSARGRGLDYTVNIYGFPAGAKRTTMAGTTTTEAGDASEASSDGDAAAKPSTSTSADADS